MSTIAPRIPTATYRFQFHKGFTFNQARALIPYLHSLGISDCYASPIFQASPGSTHGYDIVDHTRLNSEIGTELEFVAFVNELKKHNIGLVADFVPNHMGVGEPTNVWWTDVLENGPSSLAATCFDIDWKPLKEELKDKVLLPVLGDHYGRVLEKGELKVSYEEGSFVLNYYQNRYPIDPRTYPLILQSVLTKLPPSQVPAVGVSSTHRLGQDFVAEFESITHQFQNLPLSSSTERKDIEHRAREKEVAKKRLAQLTKENPRVQEAINDVLGQLNGKEGDSKSFDSLDQLIRAQSYRLSFWKVAAEEINYRRFFDVNTLAAIRVELPEVFEAAHQLVWKLIDSGAITGLRIDHPDGLYDPKGYFQNLQKAYARTKKSTLPEDGKGIYLLVEKIVSGDERLPKEWAVHGTTGYEFTNEVLGVFIDKSAESSFSDIYQQFYGKNIDFKDLVYEKKRLVMNILFANDVNVLGQRLNRVKENDRRVRDFTLNALTQAIREVIASFPVYRTYNTKGQEVAQSDRDVIEYSVAEAKKRNPGIDTSPFDFLKDVLLMKFSGNSSSEAKAEHENFVFKFQQCTGPIMAKGLEDTSFYIYNRLAALNEVGGEPNRFGVSVDEFHRINCQRRESHPHTMLATSTHDTKRSEDVRTRIAVLSEMPERWRENVQKWSEINRAHKTDIDGRLAPDANEEYLLYQHLLGVWPTLTSEQTGSALATLSDKDHETLVSRVQEYLLKAIKEAKVNCSWIDPHEGWIQSVRKFVSAIIPRSATSSSDPFLQSFEPFAADIAQAGAINSLAQTVLKLTSPGVPDIYQGNELWDFSLVDPDNRRPVDYDHRQKLLAGLTDDVHPAQLLLHWQDGRIKMFVTTKILKFRRENPRVFESGSYQPLKATGKFAENVVAFVREWADLAVMVIVPRLSTHLGYPPVGNCWSDTALSLEGPGSWKSLFHDKNVGVQTELKISSLLEDFPVAVLVRI